VLAEEAVGMGLVNRVLPPDELLPFALDYARRLATEVSPSSVAMAKAQLYADLHGDVGTAVEVSERLLDESMQRPDYAEGVAALLEKRPPRFSR